MSRKRSVGHLACAWADDARAGAGWQSSRRRTAAIPIANRRTTTGRVEAPDPKHPECLLLLARCTRSYRRPAPHSVRIATTGLTLAALIAGIQLAPIATAANASPTVPN